MRQQALALADELAAARTRHRPPVPEKDITDSVELLRWLADDHFTFLGYREYRLVDEGDDRRAGAGGGARHRPGHPARRPAARRGCCRSMTPEAYAKALEKRLLIITKANSRATVHRSAYLDYIGFKIFDADGNVVGERRFLGLFSSAAYRTSVRDLPVVRRKVAEVMERSGLSPRSHSGKDLLADPGDLPARRAVPDHAPTTCTTRSIGVLRMAGRRQLRLFLRRDALRPVHLLPGLPAPGPVHHRSNRLRIQEILLRELNGVGVDYTTRVTESMLARVHFIVRTDPANPPGDDRRRRAGRAAGRRDPALGRRLPAGAGAQARRRAGQDAVPAVRRRVPGGVQGRAHAVRGGARTSPSWSCWRSPASWRCTCLPAPRTDRRARRPVQGVPVRRADDAVRRAAGAALARRAGRRRAAVRDRPGRRHRSTSTTSACGCPTAPGSWPRCARTWRTRSPPPGAARPRSTGSTSWCCGPG